MDGIEDAVIVGLTVSNLVNESPLVSSACGSYSGPHDGGAPGTIEDAGGMGTDLRGIVMAGGDALIIGHHSVEHLDSFYGDTIALDLRGDAVLDFDTGSDIKIGDISSGSKVTEAEYAALAQRGRTPYPNNFDLCTVLYAEQAAPTGEVPEDKASTDCIWNGLISPSSSDCAHPDNIYDVMMIQSIDGTFAGSSATGMSAAMPADRNTLELRTAAYDFFASHYGLQFDPDMDGFQSLLAEDGSLLVSVAQSQLNVPYRVNAFDDQTLSTPFQHRMQITNTFIDDVIFALVVHQDLELPPHDIDHGVSSLSVGQTVVFGSYRFLIDGVHDEEVMPDVLYHTSFGEVITMGSTFTFFCAVEHPWFGEGQVFGVQTTTDNADGTFTVQTRATHTYPASLSKVGRYSAHQCSDL